MWLGVGLRVRGRLGFVRVGWGLLVLWGVGRLCVMGYGVILGWCRLGLVYCTCVNIEQGYAYNTQR